MQKPAYINIENIVASADYHRNFNLTAIVGGYSLAEYRPEQFPGLVYRTTNPKTAILIFSSGKMVCTGAKKVKDVYKAIKKVTKDVIEKIFGKQPQKPDISIQNIVASGNFYGDILLEELYRLPSSRYSVMYEPEQFPGAVVRDKLPIETTNENKKKITEKSSVFLLFASGKIVCTGCKTEKVLTTRANDLYKTLFDSQLLVKEVPITS